MVIEDRITMCELVQEMYSQCAGQEGSFVLSSNQSESLSFGDKLNLIVDPFSLNGNNKKVITKLYQEVEKMTLENMYQEMLELNAQVTACIDKMCDQLPYQLTYRTDFTPSSLLKLSDVKLEVEDSTLVEKIIAYIGPMNKICGYEIFVFTNLKSFLSNEKIEELYEYAFYNKINLFLIESKEYPVLEHEKITIIDKDRCIIV